MGLHLAGDGLRRSTRSSRARRLFLRFFSRFCTLRGAQQCVHVQIILCQTVQDDGIRAEQRERTALGLNECGVTAKMGQDAQQQAGGLVGDTKIDALGLVGQRASGEERR
ncbi:MAG: hypothetical protein ACLUB2_00040 [Butyricicoccus pullicaecorum]